AIESVVADLQIDVLIKIAEWRHHAGIVYEHIDLQVGYDGFDGLAVGYVDGDREYSRTLGLHFLQCGFVSANSVNVITGVAQRKRHGPADTARRTCDERCGHVCIP